MNTGQRVPSGLVCRTAQRIDGTHLPRPTTVQPYADADMADVELILLASERQAQAWKGIRQPAGNQADSVFESA
jgi:hypothetical protein